MTTDPIPMNWRETSAVVALLAASGVALTLGFACALPLAAFAAISALVFKPRAAVSAVLTVWLINQIIGFSLLHYPTDASTIAWGFALGIIGLLSLGGASLVLWRVKNFVGILAGFLLAFVVYEGAIYIVCVANGTGVGSFTTPIATRIFLINAASFGGLLALRALWLRSGLGRESPKAPALRHA
jgi:hypothetical protein